VFNAYLQYVEIKLIGAAIQRHRLEIPSSIQKLGGAKDLEGRLRTTFDLTEKDGQLSSPGKAVTAKMLQKEGEAAYGGGMAEGKFTRKDAYDASPNSATGGRRLARNTLYVLISALTVRSTPSTARNSALACLSSTRCRRTAWPLFSATRRRSTT
jgi:hypothetical protein